MGRDSPSGSVEAGAGELPRSGLRGRVRRLTSDRLLRNVGWYGLAELANRFTRLVTAVVLARALVPEDFGIAAIALTTFEIIGVFAMNGIGQAVVRAREEDLPSVLNTAWRASLFVCITAFLVQIVVGAALYAYTGRSEVFLLVAVLACVFLTLPLGQMQAHLIARANRLHVLAGIAVVQVAADNLLTAGLAFLGLGAWAVVLPKLLTTPIWVLGLRRAQKVSRNPAAGCAPLVPFARFAGAVIASELLVAVRYNVDKVLVGSILGLEALGVYYFVFNAGLGFSLSLTNSLSQSVFPHLAEIAARPRDMLARFDQLLLRAVAPCAAVIATQAALAPLYVPLVFGQRWEPHAYLVTILCASAIAKPLFDSACQLARAFARPRLEFYASAGLTVVAMGALAAGLPFGLATGVGALVTATIVFQIAAAALLRRHFGALHAPYSPADGDATGVMTVPHSKAPSLP